ncbi:fimbrial protein, partial [Enterobacter cloacae complex sp. P4RS]|nr:fimbrial protein [Enterobacter cloacae complex sp. P4RS]
NVHRASLTIEGELFEGSDSIFLNVEKEHSATGIGIELLYESKVLKVMHPVDIPLSTVEDNMNLPLSIRYAKAREKVEGGKVKSRDTLQFNYR